MNNSDAEMLEFKQHGDERGHLVVVEGLKDVPFEIKRIFYIYGSDSEVIRGRHANKKSEFVLINVAGTSKVRVDDGKGNEKVFSLDRPHIGIYLPTLVWKDMYDFSEDSVLLCLASEHYDAEEYIRDYDDFVQYVNKKKEVKEERKEEWTDKTKVSIVVPVYYNQDNLKPLYQDIKEKLYCHDEYEWEIVMVNDGSGDDSYSVMKELAQADERIKIYSLSRNFGSHAAILCGLSKCTGDCAVVKAADLQEPTEMVLDMVHSWEKGNNVVLAVRKDREEGRGQTFFANFYYWLVRKTSFPQMPKGGFDVYLLDKKVLRVLIDLDEKNSALTGQILWSGFKTDKIYYTRLQREIGKSRWTFRKKVRLLSDTLFSFSTFPIAAVSVIGTLSCVLAVIWAIVVFIFKLMGLINVSGWTTLFIFCLFSFGVIMFTLGILGEYLWRTFDASKNRPPYIIEDDN